MFRTFVINSSLLRRIKYTSFCFLFGKWLFFVVLVVSFKLRLLLHYSCISGKWGVWSLLSFKLGILCFWFSYLNGQVGLKLMGNLWASPSWDKESKMDSSTSLQILVWVKPKHARLGSYNLIDNSTSNILDSFMKRPYIIGTSCTSCSKSQAWRNK